MNEQLQKTQQMHHHILLEYAQKKDVLDKLAELLESGVTQENIIQWTKMCNENKLDVFALGSDLREYGDIKSAYNSLFTKVLSLKSEEAALARKMSTTKK